jgi:hypothetical protein
MDHVMNKIDVLPAEREQFTNPEPGQHSDHYKPSTSVGKGIEQWSELFRQQVRSFLGWWTPLDLI